MQRYQPPSLEQLQVMADKQLIVYLQESSTNPSRVSNLKVVRNISNILKADTKLSDQEKSDILIGAGLWLIEDISKELKYDYRFVSKKYKEGWIYNSGSRVYNSQFEQLGITKENQILDAERFIFLNKFFHYIAGQQNVNKVLKGTNWSALYELITHIEKMMIRVKRRHDKMINALIAGEPTLEMLRENIEFILSDYQKKVSNRWGFTKWKTNSNREQLIHFVYIVDDAIKNKNGENNDKTEEESRKILMGAILFVLYAINTTRSELRDMLLAAINKKSRSSISYEHRIEWLNSLHLFIKDIMRDPDFVKKINSAFQEKGLKECTYYSTRVGRQIEKLNIEKNQPSRFQSVTETTFSWGVQGGVSFFAGSALQSYALSFIPSVLVGGAGAAAFAPLAVIGPLLIFLIQKELMPTAVMSTLGSIKEKIGNVAASIVIGTVIKAYQANMTHEEMLESLDPDMKRFNQLWTHNLLTAPDSVVKPEEKEKIKLLGHHTTEEESPSPSFG